LDDEEEYDDGKIIQAEYMNYEDEQMHIIKLYTVLDL
jgi:hypothetical protein